MFTVASLVQLVVLLIVVGVILWLLIYLIDNVPMLAPFQQVARVVIMVIGVLILIVILLNFAGLLNGGVPRIR